MTSQATFWAIAGFMAGLAAAFFVLRLWQQLGVLATAKIKWWMPCAVLVFFAGALWLYARVGQPDAVATALPNVPGAVDAWPSRAGMAAAPVQQAGSMAQAIAHLKTRLSQGRGSDADWQLLQKSYEFTGDADAAALAAKHQLTDDAAASTNNAASASVQGSIALDATLAAKAQGKTLFVFAKSTDSPAPVAVFRTTVDAWPVSFTLDDSQAMMPARKLSNYDQVQVQARLSQTGQAMPRPGDWQSDAQTVTTRQGKAVTLIINKPVM